MDQFQIYIMNLLIRGLSILGIEKKKVDGKCKKIKGKIKEITHEV